MLLTNPSSPAEQFDRFRLLFVVMVTLIGLNSALHAFQYYFPRNLYPWMQALHMGISLGQLLVTLLMLLAVFMMERQGCSMRRMFREGFVERINVSAVVGSWTVTFLAIMMLGEWTESDVMLFGTHDTNSMQPTRYYLYLLTSTLTLSYSLIFCWLYRRDGDQGDTA